MATKKQKNEAAQERRKRFLEELERTNLEAQRKDRDYRERRLQMIEEKAAAEKRSQKAILAAHDIHKEDS